MLDTTERQNTATICFIIRTTIIIILIISIKSACLHLKCKEKVPLRQPFFSRNAFLHATILTSSISDNHYPSSIYTESSLYFPYSYIYTTHFIP